MPISTMESDKSVQDSEGSGGSAAENGGKQESNGSTQPRKKSRLELSNLSSRQYLDQTIVPVLLQGITHLTRERPKDPVDNLANFLMKNKDKFRENSSSTTAWSLLEALLLVYNLCIVAS